jgi:hypothetical protein
LVSKGSKQVDPDVAEQFETPSFPEFIVSFMDSVVYGLGMLHLIASELKCYDVH